MNEATYSSIFNELTKEVQIRIDTASELRKRLFDQTVYDQYLDWDTPTIGFNFEELIGSYNLSVAAATLDSHGKEPVMGTEGLETLREKVMTHQMSYPMPIEEYRKVLQILDSRMVSDQVKKRQLIDLMWGNVTKVVNSVQAKLDIIFLGALSNKGIFTFDKNNNPEGPVLQAPRGLRAREHRLQNARREYRNCDDGMERLEQRLCRHAGRYSGRSRRCSG